MITVSGYIHQEQSRSEPQFENRRVLRHQPFMRNEITWPFKMSDSYPSSTDLFFTSCTPPWLIHHLNHKGMAFMGPISKASQPPIWESLHLTPSTALALNQAQLA